METIAAKPVTSVSARRRANGIGNPVEWLVLAVLLLATILPVLILTHPQSLTVIPWLNLVDDSWLLDSCYKASHGIWLGRDVISTTPGPLYQWLFSAPSRLIGVSLGSIFATTYVLPGVAIIVAAFLISRLLMPAAAAWRRALFVLLAVVFWSSPELRVWYSLFAFVIFLRITNVVAARQRAPGLLALAAASLCIAGFLMSADAGVYTLAALLLCMVTTVAVDRLSARSVAQFVTLTAACFAIGMVLTNTFMASPLDFSFWRSSFVIASDYRWFTPLAMAKGETRLVLETVVVGAIMFAAAWWRRDPSGPWTRSPVFLLAGFVFALLMMQSALVRSDPRHVLIGISPMIVLCGAIALDEQNSGKLLQVTIPLAIVIATLMFSHPQEAFHPRDALTQLRHVVRPVASCPVGMEEFDRACLPQFQVQILKLLSAYVDAHTRADTPIVIFPYQTVFGLTSRRDVAGGVLHSYLVNGDYLNQLEIAGLQRSRPDFGLYFPDGSLSVALDSIPNFTRSPGLWFYLLGHYRGEVCPFPGAAGLIRDDTRANRMTIVRQKIADPLGPARIAKRSTSLDLGKVRWPASEADFVKLRLRVNYPPWWHLGKPSQLALRATFEDGSTKTSGLVLPPNQPTDVWFYPWDDRTMVAYFSPDPTQWRPGIRPALTGLTLMIDPFDWISVAPSSVVLESIEAVRLEMR